MKHTLRSIAVCSVTLLLAACGQQAQVPTGWDDLANQYGLTPAIQDLIAQSEITTVLEEINTHVLNTAGGVSFPHAVQSASDARLAQSDASTHCKPKVTMAGLGADLTFSAAEGCFLDGKVTVKLFPLKTSVDLKVVGLKFIQNISLQGEIVLGSVGTTSEISMLVQNGQIHLNLGQLLPPTDLLLSGRSSLKLGGGVTEISTRTNAFESKSRAGLAIIASIKWGTSPSKKVDSCFLTGADAMDPDAGDLKFCFALLK